MGSIFSRSIDLAPDRNLFVLLFGGIYPIMLVWEAQAPRKRSYSYWVVFGVTTFGLFAMACGGVFATKYERTVADRSAATHVIERVTSAHPRAVHNLEAAWRRLSDDKKQDPKILIGLSTVKPWAYSELGDQLGVFAEAEAMYYQTQDAWTWLLLCVLGIIVGVIDVVCGFALARLKNRYY